MADEIIDREMAHAIQAEAAERYVLFAWIISHDPPEHPGKFIARLATTHPTVYVMAADTLAELRAMLPPGLELSERQSGDPTKVIEIWFSCCPTRW
jgi:hypothetical protein